MSSPKIALLSPVAESVSPMAVQSVIAAMLKTMDSGLRVEQIGVTDRMLVQSARNLLAKGFLETDCEWAFWWDCDTIVPSDVVAQLYATAQAQNTKFVTGVYYQRLGNHYPVIWKKNPLLEDGREPKLTPQSELGPMNETTNDAYRHFHVFPSPGKKKPFKIDVCGFGCVLTHREMFEKIPYPWFKMISGECSEDFYFCVEAKKAGYQLWADPIPRLGHIGAPGVVYQEDCKFNMSLALPVKQEN